MPKLRRTCRKALANPLILAFFALIFSGLQAYAGSGVCLDTTARVEHAEGLPRHILSSIALTESGRWDADAKAKVAWPWTVTANGEGQYFPTKAAAIAAVRRLLASGTDSVDVGCMQINLRYHPNAFANLSEAFEPDVNVRYAARFLKELKQGWNTWDAAVRHYHSNDEDRGRAYGQRVSANHRGLLAEASIEIAPAQAQAQAAGPASKSAARFAAPARKSSSSTTARQRVATVDASDDRRAEAKAEADAWRQRKLNEYLARRAAQRDG